MLCMIFLQLYITACGQADERTDGQTDGRTGGQVENPCVGNETIHYFGVEIDGMLCGYCISKECKGLKEGKPILWESNKILIRLSVLGEGMDVRINHLFGSDPVSGRLISNKTYILSGNTTIISTTRIEGDTAFYSGNNNPVHKKVFLPGDVILETALKSPHLLRDFLKPGVNEKKYRMYEPVRGEIIEKGYIKKGEEGITLKDSIYQVIVLEETDYSTGTKATLWLNKTDGMTVKTLVAGRNIFLTDSAVVGRINKVNFDNLIFARVNKIIPDFLKVNYMKVRAKIESLGEVLTPEKLNFPGQKFTGTVTDNVIDGIFELEPTKYDGTNAPAFPPLPEISR